MTTNPCPDDPCKCDETPEQILQRAMENPGAASIGGSQVVSHNLLHLLEAARYLQSTRVASVSPFSAIGFAKVRTGGTVSR